MSKQERTPNRYLVDVAIDYGAARDVQLTRRRQYKVFRCDKADDETLACYFGQEDEIATWCHECQQRQPLYRAWRTALAAENDALRKLQAALAKARALEEEMSR